jgi:hypothetical protein
LKSAVAIAQHYHDPRTSIHVDEVEFAVAADVACDKLAAKLERRIRINGILEGTVTVTHQEGDSVVRYCNHVWIVPDGIVDVSLEGAVTVSQQD